MASNKRGLDYADMEYLDQHGGKRAAHGPVTLCIKLLLSADEALCVHGQDGIVLHEIQTATGTQLRLSGEDQHFPGTSLQELNIQGPSQQAVLGAAVHSLSKISEVLGSVGVGEVAVGGARVKCVVPALAVSGIIGPGGATVKQLQQQTGIRCSIDPAKIPTDVFDDLPEQALSLTGPLEVMHIALAAISARVSDLASESWFSEWADRSNAGHFMPGLVLFADREGKGKGKAGPMPGFLSSHNMGGNSEHGGLMGGAGYSSISASDGGGSAPYTLKLLVDHNEAGCIRSAEVEQNTSTKIVLSGHQAIYPGSDLQEIAIQGLTEKNILDGVTGVLEHIAEGIGAIVCGKAGVEPGNAHAKIIVPAHAVRAVIGVKGATVVQIRQQSQMHVHIEKDVIPPGPIHELSEQIVSLSGPVEGLHTAISLISHQVQQYIAEPWYSAWSGYSHSGTVIPGLVLFSDDAKGKGKSKGKSDFGSKGDSVGIPFGSKGEPCGKFAALKGNFIGKAGSGGKDKFGGKGGAGGQDGYGGQQTHFGMAAPAAHQLPNPTNISSWSAPPAKPHKSQMALKLLLPANEASCVLGKGGATIREIGQSTFTKLSLSSMNEFYPGTNLQELRVRGSGCETVVAAIMHALTQISQSGGAVTGGDSDVPPGDARVKVVVPAGATRIVIGKSGKNVKDMRDQSGMHVHVEETIIPPGPVVELSEQVVCFSGPMAGLQVALPMLAGFVSEVSVEPWFAAWTLNSHAGTVIPGLHLFANIRGHGKGKGGDGKGKVAGGGGIMLAQTGMAGGNNQGDFAGGMNGKGAFKDAGVKKAPGNIVAVKLLTTYQEAEAVNGVDGGVIGELMANTSTNMSISEGWYPGSESSGGLKELCIVAANAEILLAALLQALDRIMTVFGHVSCGEGPAEGGGACLKLVIPAKAAAAVIGIGGQQVKQIRQECSVRLSIDTHYIPCAGESAEQALLLSGSFTGVNVALQTILGHVSEVSSEHWFEHWASSTNAGTHIPGLQLFKSDGKGKGKSKTKNPFMGSS